MKDFVTFEIAKKLKEKGFNKECLAYYTKDSNFYYNTCCGSDVESAFRSFNLRPESICGKRIDAPTISQVLKWLRKEKSIHVELLLWTEGWYYEVWCFECNEKDKEYDTKIEGLSMEYSSYERAALAGIEYALDNLP